MLVAIIDDALNHATTTPLPADNDDDREVTVETLVEGADLTARQMEVVRLIAEGHSLGETASLLGITKASVQQHRARAWAKVEGRG